MTEPLIRGVQLHFVDTGSFEPYTQRFVGVDGHILTIGFHDPSTTLLAISGSCFAVLSELSYGTRENLTARRGA